MNGLKAIKTINLIQALALLAVVILLVSCSNTKYLAEGDSLFVGGKVKVTDTFLTKSERKEMAAFLEENIRPKPNKTFLKMRIKLYFHNIAGEPKSDNGLRNFIRNKIGEPPVIARHFDVDYDEKLLENKMHNIGYFQFSAQGITTEKKKRVKAYFEVQTGPQYKIRKVNFPQEDGDVSLIAKYITELKDESLLKSGNAYNLETIKLERERIDAKLKNIGYYYFNPDYIIANVDTGIGDNLIDIHLALKWQEMPRNAETQYTINTLTIYPNYRTTTRMRSNTNNIRTRTRVARQEDTTVVDMGSYQYKIVDRQKTFRPVLFYQSMQLHPGELYSKKDHHLSLNRLVTMGNFKMVKSEFVVVRDTVFKYNTLDLNYYLTPYPKKSFNADISGFTQNDSRAGSRGSISWRNRNTFRGGELFVIKAMGGFEMQYGGNARRPNTYNAGIDFSMNIPRFIVPFFTVKPSGMFVPRTIINTGYNFSQRGQYYTIHSATFNFGYNWKEDIKRDHKLNPISITYVRTDTLEDIANFKINLSNLVYNGFIIGSTYEYVFNTSADDNKKKNNFYISVLGDIAGNILGVAKNTSLDQPPKNVFGSQFAQYLKFQTDFRYYYKLQPNTIFAARWLTGVGVPYGNSYQLPNVKQFFSGGSNSLRGFPPRLVGPGTFHVTNTEFIEVLGDIKLELSGELRAKLYQFIDGALFIDAGNIWMFRDNPNFVGGTFSNNFYNELAVSAGLGVRLDFSILVLRLDFATPVRKPWMAQGDRWRFHDMRIALPEWRKENLFFNLAIGYPF